MDNTPKIRRLLSPYDIPSDAVRIHLVENAAQPVASVVWPENKLTAGGGFLYPTNIQLALERAFDVAKHYGFAEIVVIDEHNQWDDAAFGLDG